MNLLVMACGGTKNETTGKVRAIDLYAGRQFALARKLYAAEGWEVVILSAEHGFISADHQIANYDCMLDAARVAEFATDDFQWHILRVWGQGADRIVFYGGAKYAEVWASAIEANGFAQVGQGKNVEQIVGRGLGDHFSVLKEIAS